MHKLVVNKPRDSVTLLRMASESEPIHRPVYQVPAGYPSAAQDYIEPELDLNEHMLGHRRASVFFFRIGGDSMKEAGILNGDIIIVDRALEVLDGHIVVASVFGEYTCKYYRKHKSGVWLEAANPEFKPIKITEESDFTIFGRYDGLVRKSEVRNRKPFKAPFIE